MVFGTPMRMKISPNEGARSSQFFKTQSSVFEDLETSVDRQKGRLQREKKIIAKKVEKVKLDRELKLFRLGQKARAREQKIVRIAGEGFKEEKRKIRAARREKIAKFSKKAGKFFGKLKAKDVKPQRLKAPTFGARRRRSREDDFFDFGDFGF